MRAAPTSHIVHATQERIMSVRSTPQLEVTGRPTTLIRA